VHNFISHNQLDGWKNTNDSIDRSNMQIDLMNDYFNCMIECDDDQQTCKRICRDILVES
jgi:hypothetical protein